jgi:hypothetical protein
LILQLIATALDKRAALCDAGTCNETMEGTMSETQKVGNGKIKLPLTESNYFTITGGPYRRRPVNYRGVKLAVEIGAPCDVSIPIRDYDVPTIESLNSGIYDAVAMLGRGEALYAGCMGGIGRTGLFLACLVKCFGVKDPVEYVREHYYGHAVETELQYKFVRDFKPTKSLMFQLGVLRVLSVFKFWQKGNLSKIPLTPQY